MALDDSYSKVLLHMDGADASQTFTDESGKTWTAHGNAQIDTAQSVFGGASGLFDGNGDYISTPDSTDFDFGTGDWTIDTRIRRNGNLSGYPGILATSTALALNGGYSLSWSDTKEGINKILFASYMSGSWEINLLSASAISDLTWAHVAVVRYGNTMTLYVDGTASGSTYNCTGQSLNSKGLGAVIGLNHVNSSHYHNGWIDELRISKGIARWTSNFTPPTEAYAPPLMLANTQILII